MSTDSFRAVIATVIVAAAIIGGYLTWHVTHPAHHSCAGGAYYSQPC